MSENTRDLDLQKSNRDAIQKVIESSESDFETKITYLSSGALGLSITFAEKFIKVESSDYLSILISGWVLLILTLSVNLVSVLLSKHFSIKARNEIDNNDDKAYDKIIRRNGYIDSINWTTAALLLVGIILVTLFSSINLYKKSIVNADQKVKSVEVEKKLDNSIKNPTTVNPIPAVKDTIGN